MAKITRERRWLVPNKRAEQYAQELKAKVRQHGYSSRNDIGEIEVVDYNEIF